MTDSFTPIPFDGFVSALVPQPFGGVGTQIGETIAGMDGKHYSIDWTFNGPCLICAEDGTQQDITSARFAADQSAHGYPGVTFFVPAYGAFGIPNTPYFYVWAQDGAWLFGNPSQIVFLRYKIAVDGSFNPDGGNIFLSPGAGGNRYFTINPSGGNGRIWAVNVVNGYVYAAYESSVNPGAGVPCMFAMPFVSTYSAAQLDWLQHNINLSSNFGNDFWRNNSRSGLTGAWLNTAMACLVDNGDGTGSAIEYCGAGDIAGAPNANIAALPQAAFLTFDFKFTPSGLGGSWTIGSLYNQNVTGITFPFADANKNKAGAAANDADDYYSPSVCLIHGTTYLLVPRAYTNQSEWSPHNVGVGYLVFSYVKGTMTFADGTYKDSPYDPADDFAYAGNELVATIQTFQAFVARHTDEIWGLNKYTGDGQFVYFRIFRVRGVTPPPVEGGDDDVSHIRPPVIPPVRQLRTFEEAPFAEYRVGAIARSEFPVRFKVMEQADLRVQIDDVELTQDDFTFTGRVVGFPGYDDSAIVLNDNNPFPGFKGGKVTLVGTVTNCLVRIWSDPAPARTSDYGSGEVQMAQANRATETLWVRNRAQHLKLERDGELVTGTGAIEAVLMVDDVETPLIPSGTLEAASVGRHLELKGPVLAAAFAGDTIYDGPLTGTTYSGAANAYAQLISPKTGIWYVARKAGAWSLT